MRYNTKYMAGHSKWNNIKQRKGAVDAKRAKIFGNLAKLIKVAVKEGKSADPKFNPGLRLMLEKARAANMSKTNIDRAIERGLGRTSGGASISEIIYEGFAPGGVAVLVVAQTDNPNRTAAEIKFAFSRHGGSLGGPGTAMYMFQRAKDGGYEATMKLEVADEATMTQVLDLIDAIRECEDVEDIYLATDLPEDEQ